MPAERDISCAPVAPAPVLLRLLRLAVIAIIVGFALFCALLLTVRFVVFPRVDAYRDTLAGMMSREFGAPVEIDRITAGWDGWNPKLMVQGLRVRDQAGVASVPLLELPEVDLIVAWTSLLIVDVRLKQLIIDGPRLAIRRDTDGAIHVAGMALDRSQEAGGEKLTDWVLRQPQIVIRNAHLTWNDDLRNAPELALDSVQLHLVNGFGRHRFGLRGTPPAALSAPIDLRGDVRGVSLRDWQAASGKLYVRLDYADVAAWREWVPFPAPIASGKGALRMWVDFAHGDVSDAVADLELADVRAQLKPELPQLDLTSLSGRVGWRNPAPERVIYARELAFSTADGHVLAPTDFSLTLRDANGNAAATGLAEFDHLQLAPLRDMAVHLPLPERLRGDLARFAPRGTLTHGRVLWEGPADAPKSYSASTDFANVGIVAQAPLPGLAQFSGHLEATQAAGRVKLVTRGGSVQLPRILDDPITLDSLQGDVSWEHRDERTIVVRSERLDFVTPDGTGMVSGEYRTAAQGPGEIDLTAQLARGDVARIYRYLPIALGESVREWVHTALPKGRAEDIRLRVAGKLADFPFADGKGGRFSLTARGRDVTLDYAKGWPVITGIDGDVRLDGAGIVVEATRGQVFDVPLQKVHVDIKDMRAKHPLLHVDGEAAGATSDFLRFIEGSPVGGWIDHFTRDAVAGGEGRLALKLDLPIGNPVGNKVDGQYHFVDNDLRLAGVPPMAKFSGTFFFTEHDFHASDVSMSMLGGPAKVAITSGGGHVHVGADGTASIASLLREYELTYSDLVSGTFGWTLAGDVNDQGSTWVVTSNMKGSAVDLPPPVGKTAAETVPLRIERRSRTAQAGEDGLTMTYGAVGRLVLHRKVVGEDATVDRALLMLGKAAEAGDERADRPGLWVRGAVPALNVDDWLNVRKRATAGSVKEPAGLELTGADIDVGVLDAFGRRFNEMKIAARRTKDDWRLDLRARELAGTATWTAPNKSIPNGRIAAHLARLMAPEAGEEPTWKGARNVDSGKPAADAGNAWPTIDLVADSYFSRGRDIGALKFDAHPSGADWRIEGLTLTNDAGKLSADGSWIVGARRQQTKLDVLLDVSDAGRYLVRFGFPDAVSSAPTKVKGQLEWAGAPSDFDYPTLNGSFHIDVGAGRFTRIDPGIGKLLGVLSLQSLPKRLALDFTDVFSEGFAFEQIVGDVMLQNGVMRTQNLRLNGPAAKVEIAGETDLAKETQQLTVRVQPTLSAGVSAGAALLFLANPIVGAAVGAGSLLAQKVLRDPLEQMFSYEYAISGNWADPVVVKHGNEKRTPIADAPPQPALKK